MARLWISGLVRVGARTSARYFSAGPKETSSSIASSIAGKGSSDQLEEERVQILNKSYPSDGMTNVTPTIASLVGRNLHLTPHHPITIIKERVVQHMQRNYTSRTGNAIFAHFDNVPPVVTTEQNFDSLLIAKDHVARSKHDNYYINHNTMLRAHTSAHQRDFIRMGLDRFLVTGDVYRRDEIDRSHYPAFHQMEGVRLFTREELFQNCSDKSLELFERPGSDLHTETGDKQRMHTLEAVKLMELSLKDAVVLLVKELFGSDIEYRWNPCYFPFTHPSYELEIKFKGEWMEMLGSGIMRQEILVKGGARDKIGWAFGLGLDRLAMLLFGIPDIRLFWSRDERFISQFTSVGICPSTNITFAPYSKHPPCSRDFSFWVPEETGVGSFSENDFCDLVRSIAGDWVEKVERIDEYTDGKTGCTSLCYRITYRAMDRTLTNEEVNVVHTTFRERAVESLGVEPR